MMCFNVEGKTKASDTFSGKAACSPFILPVNFAPVTCHRFPYSIWISHHEAFLDVRVYLRKKEFLFVVGDGHFSVGEQGISFLPQEKKICVLSRSVGFFFLPCLTTSEFVVWFRSIDIEVER